MATVVVFRKFKDGYKEVIALFPRIPEDLHGNFCMSYMHVGQHGGADPGIVSTTTPAKPAEYAALLKELKSLGYNDIVVHSRVTADDNETRRKTAKKQWGKLR
jgi:hypothetical protein